MSQSGNKTSAKPAPAPVTTYEQKSSSGSNMASTTASTAKKSSSGSNMASTTASTAKSNLSAPDVKLYSAKGWAKSGSSSSSAAAQVKTTASASVSKPAANITSSSSTVTFTTPSSTTKSVSASVKVDPVKTAKPSPATTAKSTITTTTVTAESPASTKTSTTATKAEPKVQVEVRPTSAATTAKQTSPAVDPLDLLASSLPSAAPVKPEVKYSGPEVTEEVTSEKGVRVGEREDTLPPGYRLSDMAPVPVDVKPAEPAVKPLSTADALDLLSDGFSSKPQSNIETVTSAASAQTNFAPAPKPAKQSDSAAPPADKKAKLDSDVFSLSSAVETKSAADQKLKKDPSQVHSPTTDALSALGDLLPTAEVPKEEPELVIVDITTEAPVEEEEGVRVGEREDTLPPEYRLTEEEKRRLPPPPKPQPSLDTAEALDILSGDFCEPKTVSTAKTAPTTQKAAPAAQKSQAAQKTKATPPAQLSADAALESLAGDFVSSSAAPTLQSSSCPEDGALGAGADSALDALSDVLKDIAPTPEPEPPMPKNIVKEKQIEEERLIKMGEREDTLPPEFRLTDEEKQKMEEEKKKVPESPKQKPMDDKTALDLLAGDFSSCPAPDASETSSSVKVSSSSSVKVSSSSSSAPVSSSASVKVSSSPSAKAGKGEAPQQMPGKVLESLSETLLPTEMKKTEKTKKSPAEGAPELPTAPSKDVLPKS